MEPLAYEQLEVREELSYRILKNYARLEGTEYKPDKIFYMSKNWPGDWEGRTRLAWVMLARISGRKPAYLAAMDKLLEQRLNSRHYFKQILPEGMADEQQVSGHNWFLRSLLEEYLWTGSAEAERRAKKLVENLYLPLRGMYKKYPFRPDNRNQNGRASGHIEGEAVDGWYLSTDIGCAFMPFDGLSQYYQIFHDERVGMLLDEMTDAFRKIDLVACGVQTHATLSAGRGIIRYYQSCGRRELLSFAEELFSTYVQYGMTENYANYNWFGRPVWTEPCAIVDSYLLAVELFKETKKLEYIRISNRILYNGLSHAQRENGGFGCDLCAGGEGNPDTLAVYPECYEAYWCCSMRGGEGLAKAAAQAVLKDGETYLFLNYIPMRYESGEIAFTVSTKYPYEGKIVIQLEKLCEPVKMKFYIPQSAACGKTEVLVNNAPITPQWENGLLSVAVKQSGTIQLDFALSVQKERPVNQKLESEYAALWYGDLMLGHRQRADEQRCLSLQDDLRGLTRLGGGRFQIGEHRLEPVGEGIYHGRKERLAFKFRILYPIKNDD